MYQKAVYLDCSEKTKADKAKFSTVKLANNLALTRPLTKNRKKVEKLGFYSYII
jgi:hypothetical protein